jgi:SAM-dependent methyltransferase
MKRAGGRASARAEAKTGKAALRVVGTTVQREIELLLEALERFVGRRAPRVLQVGARTAMADRNEHNWRGLLERRFGRRAHFVGIDLMAGTNVDHVLDICSDPRTVRGRLGADPFDLVICCHVLEHTREPGRAARNIERVLKPGGLAYVATPWSQAFHAAPDDYWRFSARGLMLLFERLDVLSAFYSGGDVGLDVAYRVVRDGKAELDSRAGAVEQGLFQLVLDHEQNRELLARQATERLPVSRTYLPTLFVNIVARRLCSA